ncbi:MAG TPA: Hsp70 family protein [Pirellulales bacterium]|jgi:molecular chaperone DnaK|nr:Hsp70 family protein [Pirellulales bacterium]
MPANLRLLLEKHGLDFLQAPLQRVVGEPASVLDDDEYADRVILEAWRQAPMQLRLFSPETLRWGEFCLAIRPRVFDVSSGKVKLRSDWRAEASQAAEQFGVGGEDGEDAPLATLLDDEEGPAPGETAELLLGETGGPGRSDPNQRAIGIDLGTTYSVVAHVDPQGRPTSIANSHGDLLTPSVVLFDADGTVVGREAVLAAALEPDSVAECVKRDMGNKFYRKKINGELLPPEVVSSYILRRLKADAEREIGPVSKAVITVPAYFDETRRRATMDAGKLAGLEVLDILNEPTAAAIVYGYQEGFLDRSGKVKGDRALRVLVYDLGGGTFDVTVVEMTSQSFKAIATDGDVRLGGKDWDEKLVELAAARLTEVLGEDPREDAETRQELWIAAETAKKTLSERTKATISVNHQGKRHKVEVTREEFEEATAPLVLRTRTTAEIVVMQAGLTWKEIDRVVVVGGATRMPMIVRMLAELAGHTADHSVSADEAVAHGAALYADLLLAKQGAGSGQTAFSVTNVNSHSLGVVGVDPLTGRRRNRIIIPKNTPLPHSASGRFKTYRANQPNVKVTVMEGESDSPDACTEVGLCVIQGLPPNLPAGWPVEVRYTYRENGRLQVSASLVGHAAGVTTEFVRDNRLSDDDLMLWAECLSAEAQRADW